MEARIPLIGERLPEFKVKTTHGMKSVPVDYRGKWLILFSHPADFTPVCTTEFVAFNRRYDEFRKLNCELIGLSIDQVFSHIKWVQWIRDTLKEDIKFPVIADDVGTVSAQLGFIHPGKATNTVRAVLLMDPEGIVRSMIYYPQELGRNIDEIVRMVRAMQISDQEKVAMPAGWPNNELIKDHVIVPPPMDEQTARKRAKEYDCYDWWFCHKPLKKEEAAVR